MATFPDHTTVIIWIVEQEKKNSSYATPAKIT